MNGKVRTMTAAATLALGMLAGAGSTAQAAGSDNHHESKPEIDCRNSSYGAAAVLSPTIYADNHGDNSRKCSAVDQPHHPSLTSLLGLVNLT